MKEQDKLWWESVAKNWDDLKQLIITYHPNSRFKGTAKRREITALAAEDASKIARKRIDTSNPLQMAEDARHNRHKATLYKILMETWFGMPESKSIRDEPGFFPLCNLISEE